MNSRSFCFKMFDLKIANHEDGCLRQQRSGGNKHIAGMETRMTVQDIDLDRRRAEFEALQEELARMRETYGEEFAKHEKLYRAPGRRATQQG